jgi:hypothetical protein
VGRTGGLADGLGVELDDVRERHESLGDTRADRVRDDDGARGRVAAVRFAVEGVRAGLPVITMEHVNRLTDAAAPHWPYPPDGRPGVHRATVAGDPGVEINAHVGCPASITTRAA